MACGNGDKLRAIEGNPLKGKNKGKLWGIVKMEKNKKFLSTYALEIDISSIYSFAQLYVVELCGTFLHMAFLLCESFEHLCFRCSCDIFSL